MLSLNLVLSYGGVNSELYFVNLPETRRNETIVICGTVVFLLDVHQSQHFSFSVWPLKEEFAAA